MVIRFVRIICLGLCSTLVPAQEYDFSINWDNGQACSISISNAPTSKFNFRLAGKEKFIFGNPEINNEVSTFTPLLPFTNDLTYEAVADNNVVFSFTPTLEVASPNVVSVYPRSNQLPENFLKFYLVFDQPMSVGRVYDYLHLFQGNKEVSNPFIPLQPELWDEEKKVLTLWIDPGRVKQELLSNQTYGPVLKKGLEYKLLLDEEFKSAAGKPLGKDFMKSFLVVNQDVKKPNSKIWKLASPNTESKEPLTIFLSEPMDYSILSFIQIDVDGEKFEGEFSFESDSILKFTPSINWTARDYAIRIEAIAEDLAGNNFNRLFDQDINRAEESYVKPPFRWVYFSIK